MRASLDVFMTMRDDVRTNLLAVDHSRREIFCGVPDVLRTPLQPERIDLTRWNPGYQRRCCSWQAAANQPMIDRF